VICNIAGGLHVPLTSVTKLVKRNDADVTLVVEDIRWDGPTATLLHFIAVVEMRSRAQEGSRELKRNQDGSGWLKRAQEGSGWLKRAQEGSGWLKRAQEISRGLNISQAHHNTQQRSSHEKAGHYLLDESVWILCWYS
jgi:hypothetical protein